MAQFIHEKQLLIRRIALIILDALLVFLSSVFALWLRLELSAADLFASLFLESLLKYLPFEVIFSIMVFYIFRLYHSLWGYAGISELERVVIAAAVSDLFYVVSGLFFTLSVPRSFYFIYLFVLILLLGGSRFCYRVLRRYLVQKKDGVKTRINVLLAGSGMDASNAIKELLDGSNGNLRIKCIASDNKHVQGQYLLGIKIAGRYKDIPALVKKHEIDEIIIALPANMRSETKKIIEISKDTGCAIKILPGIKELMAGEGATSQLRNVEVEDLLGRDPVEINAVSVKEYIEGKTVLVTGGGGSIGSELCRQLALCGVKTLIIVDIYENNAYAIEQELKADYPELNLHVLIASVRNYERLLRIFEEYKPEVVYHAAAHKHVPLMETSPNEAIKNNVFGTLNTVKAADATGVKRFIMISTDKAVNPTNVMGASKRICEMIIQTWNTKSRTEYVAVRFGNVLGSNGSVIPLFKQQIAAGGPVTVTHPDIIRYFMTIPEAVSLVLQAGAFAKGGEIFVLDMGEPVKILDLAINLIRLSGHIPYADIDIKFTGLRPGEKLYEELLMDEEGLTDTDNALIHIGKPISLDEKRFEEQLDKLKELAFNDSKDIRKEIMEIVPTYKPQNNA